MRRIHEFLNDYGLDDIETLSAAIQGRSEQALRNAIRALPDGVSDYEITADGYLEPFTLRLKIEIRGSDILMDFAGSSPQQNHSAINAAFNISYATAVYPIKAMLAPHIPNNDGLVRPLQITAPEGSIVNCTFPAPVKARAKVIKHIPPLIFGALAPLLPNEVIAAAGGIFPFHIVGQDEQHGRYAVHMLPHGGLGATRDADGLLPAAYPHNSTVTPTEIIENQSPVIMTRKAMLTDSGGAGRRRGGPGQQIVVRYIGEKPTMLTIRPDLMKYPAPGLSGGDFGAPGNVHLKTGDKVTRVERFTPIRWNPGEEVILQIPGGGGYGDPREREHERVQEDVALGYVSIEAARDIYGLEITQTPEEMRLEAIRRYVEAQHTKGVTLGHTSHAG
jgi:N-methylhydantoinase B